MNIGIVLLYGLYTPERKDYKEYLDFVSEQTQKENLEKIVLCGGFTDPKNPSLSEALTAERYLKSTINNFDSFIKEDKSINTNQNLEFAARKINKSDNLIVFCDFIRIAKVIWISEYFLLGESYENIYKSLFDFAHQNDIHKPFLYKKLKIITYDFPNKTKEEIVEQSMKVLIDVMALYNKDFNDMDIKQRISDFGL